MFSWLARRVLDHAYGRLNAGDPGAILRLDANDVHFQFPGESSWTADIRGKHEVEHWLNRMIAVCLRGSDHLTTAEGETVYSNRYVIWGRMAWGRLREYEVYEDTQKLKGFDEYLAAREAAPAY
jgi:ketosteroid isomerase-like protein